MHRTQGGIARTLPICDGLKVVIILLTAMEDRAITNLVPCKRRDVGESDAVRAEEGEVLIDEGNGVGS
jgi:hypothetical protein